MKRTFLVVYEKGKKNFGGFAPDVPGCFSLGDTIEEMRLNLREALEFYMEVASDSGQPLPEPASTSVTLPFEGDNDPKTTYVVEHLTIRLPRAAKTARRLPSAIRTRKATTVRQLEAA